MKKLKENCLTYSFKVIICVVKEKGVFMVVSLEKKQSISLGLRVSPEVKGLIEKLTKGISDSLGGAKVSQTQAVEIAIREAVAKRGL